jgi:GPH family glycoside/pentoside/hexuronide:cation symporter
VSAEDGLPLRTKLLYASSSLGGEALTQSRGLWLLYFYAPPADADIEGLLPRVLAGALLTAGRLLEAFDDALIGWWSDRTRSRLGRRLPFILGATPFWALFTVLLFTPPRESGTAVIAVYFFFTLELGFLFSTLSGGPYEALLPEIARRSRDRVSIAAMRFYFGAAGGAVGVAASPLLKDAIGFRGMALVMAVLLLVTRYVGMAGVWRLAKQSRAAAEVPFRQALRLTFSNRSFLAFLPTFVLFQTALQLLLGALPFFVDSVLGYEDEATWVAVLGATAIVAALAAVPLFTRLASRRSKREAYSTAMAAAALAAPLFFVAGLLPAIPREAQVVVIMAIIGVPLAGNYLFPATLTADIADDDLARTGMRREAMYFGSQNLVEKTATSVAPLLLALLLLAGDTAENPLGIRLVGPVAGLLLLAGYLVFRGYRLPDEIPIRRADSGR